MKGKRRIRVLVSGACGRMGREVVRAVAAEKDMAVAGGVDVAGEGRDVGEQAGAGRLGVPVTSDLKEALSAAAPDVVVDFTTAAGFEGRAMEILRRNCRLVAGTTGIPEPALEKIRKTSERRGLGVIVAPNFAVGAVLMMNFARQAARFLPDVEIVELHHDRKADAPSGTALYTAGLVNGALRGAPGAKDPTKTLKLKGCRGGRAGRVTVHSVRLPGFLAHQEVIFGGPGQTLTIRHDTTSREAFMPGVLFAVRAVVKLDRFVYGLENLM
ncbi:MAG: 4-hydroxy-tetrahydrodipicolinate reductase [bacterium]